MREKMHSGKTPTKHLSFLDKPFLGGIRLDWWTLVYVLLIILAVGTRFWDLGSRAYSHDESIHASWSWDLYTGKGYRHNPTYHGPFMYHFTAFIFVLFGDSDVTARVSPALFGVALVFLPLLMKKWLGRLGTLVATALLMISPIIMHRSRYIRTDIYTIVFEVILIIAAMRYLEERREKHLYLIAGAMALAFCSKETAFIYQGIVGTFLVFRLLVRWLREQSRPLREYAEFDLAMLIGTLCLPLLSPFPVKLAGFDPTDYSNTGIARSGIVFLIVVAISTVLGLWWGRRRWLVAAGIFYLICATLFTTMFTNGQGFATGMLGSLGYWLQQQGVKRGGQPWFYYLLLVPMYDFLPLLFSLCGIGYALPGLIRKAVETNPEVTETAERAPFIPFLIYWALLSFLLYSWAGEKMPWLAMNILVPFILLAGWYIAHLLEGIDFRAFREGSGWVLVILIPLFITVLVTALTSQPFQGTTLDQLGETMQWLVSVAATLGLAVAIYFSGRKLGLQRTLQAVFLLTLIVLTALTVRFAWMGTFKNGDVPVELMVYAQGTPDVPRVMREITLLSERMAGGLDLKVAYDDESSWPFVWYLRNFKNAQYYAKKPSGPLDAPVVIVGSGNEAGVKPFLGGKYFRREYKLIWWPTETYKDLTLAKIWNGIWDPAARKNFWNIFFYRKYSYGLDNWPHYNKFMLYVRKDIAAQLWDYGPEVIAQELELPGEEYDKAYKQIAAQSLWGREGSGEGQLRSPKGIALDAEGNIYVADTYNHRVVKFNTESKFVAQWGSEGIGPGQFKEPWSLAVGRDGSIYVADTWNHRIQRLTKDGIFVTMWGSFGDTGGMATGQEGLFYGPRDIAIDANGDLYVTDTGNKRVIKFDPNGKYLGQWGGAGALPGEFLEPVGIAIDKDGNFYVADTWNRRIQKFDPQFRPLAQWPVYGWEGESVVNKPYLAVDGEGNIYFTDPELYRVVKLSPEGKVLMVWGQLGGDAASLNLPTGIKVDETGNVYVADSNNHRIVKYGPVR